MSPTAMKRLISRIQSNNQAVWVFCGDSITHGALHTEGWRDYVELIEERVRYEKGQPLHLFVNSAISGHNTRLILEQFTHRVRRFQPDVFSLMIGMNDCAVMPVTEYADNVKTIVERVRKETPADALLHTCCAINPVGMETRKTYPEFMEALRRLAPELDVALIDHHAEWERVRLQDDDLYQSWMSDAIHPNALGHWVFAERTLKELEIGPLERTKPPVSGTPFVRTMRVSRLLPGAGKLDGLRYPHALSPLGFQRRKFTGRFCDVHAEFGARAPEDLLIYFACQVECAEPMGLVAQLGYDGPVKLWMDGVEEFHDPNGTNPAEPDMARVWFQAGRGPHEILVALGSNRGNAWGIFLRLERASTSHRVGALDGISLTSR